MDISRIIAWLLTAATVTALIWLGYELFTVVRTFRRRPSQMRRALTSIKVVCISGGAVITVLVLSGVLSLIRLINPNNAALNMWSYVFGEAVLLIFVLFSAANIRAWRIVVTRPGQSHDSASV